MNDDLFPKIKKSIENLIEDEEGNIPGKKLLFLGTMALILGSMFSVDVFAKHKSHSSHSSHSSGKRSYHSSHSSHTSHQSHTSATTHSNHSSSANSNAGSGSGTGSNSPIPTSSVANVASITSNTSEQSFNIPQFNFNNSASISGLGTSINNTNALDYEGEIMPAPSETGTIK